MRPLMFAFLIIAMTAVPAQSESWRLDEEASSFSFGSIKAGSIGEAHHFEKISGRVEADGTFSLMIDLSSVETGIGIRNERMRKFLFEVANFSEAVLAGTLDLVSLNDLPVGGIERTEINATLDLHGQQNPVQATVAILRLAENRVAVSPDQIIFVDTANFALSDGVDKLRELAGLPSISGAVPVSFNLVFDRTD